VLRVATPEDLTAWTALRERFRKERLDEVRERAVAMGLTMKIVEVEPVLGGEYVAVHYLSEERVDFRELVPQLARHFHARVEMHQIGARDEARLTADYEKCGQHCCCKNFLKVLKPVSMKSAKTQKASLDPLKISGRCGRLMCCLRYEDETYEDLKKKLPKLKTRVGTSEGTGIVVDTKILVQLALVRLEADGREVAVPVEELLPPDAAPPAAPRAADPLRGAKPDVVARKAGGSAPRSPAPADRPSPGRPMPEEPSAAAPRRKRRRRRGKGGAGGPGGGGAAPGTPPQGG
jgi:cell fate regulator YaaT (PSP1 superfamily)